MRRKAKDVKTVCLLLSTQTLLAQGIQQTLVQREDCTVEVASPEQDTQSLLELASQLLPAVTLLDATCFDALTLFQSFSLSSIAPFGRLILLSGRGVSEQRYVKYLQWGVAAFVKASHTPNEFLSIFSRVLQMDVLYSLADIRPEDEHSPTEHVAEETSPQTPETRCPLGRQQLNVLTLMAQGNNVKAISTHLALSRSTVRNHITTIFSKLGVHDRTQAVVIALQQGWISYPEQQTHTEATPRVAA